jgi:hypothetical protein
VQPHQSPAAFDCCCCCRCLMVPWLPCQQLLLLLQQQLVGRRVCLALQPIPRAVRLPAALCVLLLCRRLLSRYLLPCTPAAPAALETMCARHRPHQPAGSSRKHNPCYDPLLL